MRSLWMVGVGLGAALACALLLGGCEDKMATAKAIPQPPYNNTGTLDPSFGGNGKAFAATGIMTGNFSPLVNGDDRLFTVTTDAAGNVLAGGYIFNASNEPDMGVLRLSSGGLLDFSFNGGNAFFADVPGPASTAQSVRGLALQADGNIVAVGSHDPAANIDPVVWRLFANGTGFDSAFAGTGYYNTPPAPNDGTDIATAVAIDSAQRIVVAGYTLRTTVGQGFDMAVWRLLPNGTLDATSGTGGLYLTQAAGDQLGNALALDGADNVYVAGSDNASGVQKLAVWKLLGTTGAVDTTFGTSGEYTHTGTPGADAGNTIAIDGAGRAVVAGSQSNGTDDDGVVIRLTAAGAGDPGFGTAGVVTIADPAGGAATQDAFNGIAIDGYGRIVVAGTGGGPAGHANDMVLLRMSDAGAADASFGTGGVITSHNAAGGNGDDFGMALHIDASGRILVAGYSMNAGGSFDPVVWRYK